MLKPSKHLSGVLVVLSFRCVLRASQRAFERFLTPSSLGGAGFRSCARNNNAAWAASVAACAALGDPNFDYGRQFLVSEALLVQAKLVQQLGSLDAASELLDVSDSSPLATSDFYSEPRANLQKS